MVGLSVLLFVGTVLLLRESNRRGDRLAFGPARMLRNYADLLCQRAFLGYAATLGCMFAGVFSYMTASPYIFLDLLNVSPETFGSFFLATAAAWTVSSFVTRSEEHTSELQSLMRISYAVFCLKKKK